MSVTALTAWRRPSIIPGFGLTLGFALTYLSLIVLIPISALILRTDDDVLGTILSRADQ